MDKARETAAKVLLAVHEQDAYANVALVQALRRSALKEVDRRFVTELVYGAVKAGETLDWILGRYASRPLKKIPPMVREILRTGIYQIFFMDRVPPSAACNEAVELTKKYSHAGTVKFVNGVLRAAAREPERARFPREGEKSAEYLALSGCHPLWLVKDWIRAFGYEEAEALCAFDNEQPLLSLRTNTLKIRREELMERLREEGAEALPSRWTPEGILCPSHGALDDLGALRDGYCQAQDESSMLVAHVLGARPGEFVIDLCAAPGGKATHIGALMENRGRVLACDVHDHKIRRMKENASRLGVRILEAKRMDGRNIGEAYRGRADRVLVDAPCSGLGVLRRRPDARWKKEPRLLRELPGLQRALLESAALAVKPGGVLVYSTCTINPEENQRVAESFLEAHGDFCPEDTGSFLPRQRRGERMVQLLPQRDGTDGFFIARMRRKELS